MNEEDIRNRHKKETKELQAKIQAIKKAVPKGDKKAKKKSVEEIAFLQKQLNDKHEHELKGLTDRTTENNVSQSYEKPQDETSEVPVKKMSKAEKRREAKAAATQKKLAEMDEMSFEVTKRSEEHLKFSQVVAALGMQIHEIPADGNCMFYAVQHQLHTRGTAHSVQELRGVAAQYMSEHETDFLPYLVHPNTGEILNEEEFAIYCQEIRTNGVWGGMHEAHAISSYLRLPIKILQADVPPIVFGQEFEAEPIILLYYKFKYGLGEHYDSVFVVR